MTGRPSSSSRPRAGATLSVLVLVAALAVVGSPPAIAAPSPSATPSAAERTASPAAEAAPAVPAVTVRNIAYTSADVTIAPPVKGGRASGYTVTVSSADGSVNLVDVVNAASTVSFTGLPAGTGLTVEVTATGPGGSTTARTTFTTKTSPVKAPAVPRITIGIVDQTSISVTVADGAGAPVHPDYPTTYQLALTRGDEVKAVPLNGPGSFTFVGLTPSTEYIVSANASNIAGVSEAAFTRVVTPARAPISSPSAPRIAGTTVTADGAVISVAAGGGGGSVDSYAVTVTGQGRNVVKTSRTAGRFVFTGLPSGLYSFAAEAKGPGGSGGVMGYSFVVPERPTAVTAEIVDRGPDHLLGQIRSHVNKPDVTGPLALAPLRYTITLVGGGERKTVTTDDNVTDIGGRFAFSDLKPSTAYTVTVVAENVAGSHTITLKTTTAPKPLSPLSTATPKIAGTVKVGRTLTVQTGAWGPAPVALSYQWKRDGASIPGANSPTYTLTSADAGGLVSVTVTGRKSGYSTASRASAKVAVPLLALSAAPTPTITGTAKVGSILTVRPGTWSPTPVALSYQWKRDGKPIAGATRPTYTLTAADARSAITITVTGKKAGYTTQSRTSAKVTPTPR